MKVEALLGFIAGLNILFLGANLRAFYAVWADLKMHKAESAEKHLQTQQSIADIRVEMAAKVGTSGCEHESEACRAMIKSEMCKKMEDAKREHTELWNRVNTHRHDEQGRVVVG